MKGLLQDAFTLLFARGLIRLAQLLSFVLLARLLTPSEFGWFGLVTTGIGLAATLGSLGLRQASAFQIGRSLLTAGEATGTALAAWLPLALIATTLIIVSYNWSLPGMSTAAIHAAMFVGIASTMLIMILQGVLLGRAEIRAFSTTETLPRIILAVMAAALAVAGLAHALTAIWAHVMSFLIVVPFAIYLSRRGTYGLSVRLDRLPSLITYGVAFALNLSLIVLCARLSMFVIERVGNSADVGRFFAAVRVSDIALEAASAVGLAVFSKSVQSTDTDRVMDKTARIACLMFWSFCSAGLLIAALAPYAVTFILGGGYAGAGEALRILAVGLPAAAANKVIYPAMAGQGRPWFGTLVVTTGLTTNLVAAVILVPTMGIAGGAISLVVGQFVMLIGYILTCSRLFHTKPSLFFAITVDDIQTLHRSIRKKAARLGKKKES